MSLSFVTGCARRGLTAGGYLAAVRRPLRVPATLTRAQARSWTSFSPLSVVAAPTGATTRAPTLARASELDAVPALCTPAPPQGLATRRCDSGPMTGVDVVSCLARLDALLAAVYLAFPRVATAQITSLADDIIIITQGIDKQDQAKADAHLAEPGRQRRQSVWLYARRRRSHGWDRAAFPAPAAAPAECNRTSSRRRPAKPQNRPTEVLRFTQERIPVPARRLRRRRAWRFPTTSRGRGSARRPDARRRDQSTGPNELRSADQVAWKFRKPGPTCSPPACGRIRWSSAPSRRFPTAAIRCSGRARPRTARR